MLGGWERYWDVSCFQLPAVNTRGNLGRNTVIGPGLVSIDASLVKSFPLGGTRTLQVKIEAFNLPNRANFAVPSGRIAFTGVGRRRLARDGADVGPHHIDGHDVASDSGGREADVLGCPRERVYSPCAGVVQGG